MIYGLNQRLSFALAFTRSISQAKKYPRPRPGTAERPPLKVSDPLTNDPRATVTQLEDDLTFIHRPPPSMPSPFSTTVTPASPLLYPAPSHPENVPLPPSSRSAGKIPEKPASESTVSAIRKLRLKDPAQFTRGRLAKMFGVTQNFVGQVAALKKPERKRRLAIRDAKHEKARDKWSERHSIVKAIQAKRRGFW